MTVCVVFFKSHSDILCFKKVVLIFVTILILKFCLSVVCSRIDIQVISAFRSEVNKLKTLVKILILSHFKMKAYLIRCVEMTHSAAVQQEQFSLSHSCEQCASAECDMKIAYAPC